MNSSSDGALDDYDEHPYKQRTLQDIYKNGPLKHAKRKPRSKDVMKKAPYEDMVCKVCEKGDGDPEMLLCDNCDEGFHMYCLSPILIKVPKGKWFCTFCSKKDRIKASKVKYSEFNLSNKSSFIGSFSTDDSQMMDAMICSSSITSENRGEPVLYPMQEMTMHSVKEKAPKKTNYTETETKNF